MGFFRPAHDDVIYDLGEDYTDQMVLIISARQLD